MPVTYLPSSKKVKWDNNFNVNFLDIFSLAEFATQEQKTGINYMTATVNRLAKYKEPEQLLPNDDSHK